LKSRDFAGNVPWKSSGTNVETAGLPGLLKQGGMDSYACMRPMPDENPDIPLRFHWEGEDGQSVLTQRIPGQY
jgi:hypothetical protein